MTQSADDRVVALIGVAAMATARSLGGDITREGYAMRVLAEQLKRAADLSRQASEPKWGDEYRKHNFQAMAGNDFCDICMNTESHLIHIRDRGNTRDGGGEQRQAQSEPRPSDADQAGGRTGEPARQSPPPTPSLLVPRDLVEQVQDDLRAWAAGEHLTQVGVAEVKATVAELRSILEGSNR